MAMVMLTTRMDPATVMHRYDIIDGNLRLATGAAIADFREKFGGEYTIVERSPEAAKVKVKYRNNDLEFSLTWSEVEEAKEDFAFSKGQVKFNWSTPKRRREMLFYRVMSDAIAAVCPEVFYSAETYYGNAQIVPPDEAAEKAKSINLEEMAAEAKSELVAIETKPPVARAEVEPEKVETETTVKESEPEKKVVSYSEPSSADATQIDMNDEADEAYYQKVVDLLNDLKDPEKDPDGERRRIVRDFASRVKSGEQKRLSECTFAEVDSIFESLTKKADEITIPF